MSTLYAKEEIIPVTTVVRNLSSLLTMLKLKKLSKIALLRNNALESVIIPIEDYERMREIEELFEHYEIFKMVKEREKTPASDYIELEEKINSLKRK